MLEFNIQHIFGAVDWIVDASPKTANALTPFDSFKVFGFWYELMSKERHVLQREECASTDISSRHCSAGNQAFLHKVGGCLLNYCNSVEKLDVENSLGSPLRVRGELEVNRARTQYTS